MGNLWRKLTGWLKRKPIALPKEVKGINKIAIIIGHTLRSPGAHIYRNEYGFFNEYGFNELIAEKVLVKMVSYYGLPAENAKVFRKDGIGSKGVAKAVGKWGADVSLELHLNAFSQRAFGCELLLLEASPEEIGKEFISGISYEMDITKRHIHGIKWIKNGDRGFNNLYYCLKSGVKYPMIIEPCFANFKTSDSIKVIEGYLKYANVLAAELMKIIDREGT